jgi:molybdopterin converting factor small subunit
MVYLLVNGRNIEQGKGQGTELKDGDVVSILPLMAGG